MRWLYANQDWVDKLRFFLSLKDYPTKENPLAMPPFLVPTIEISPWLTTPKTLNGSANVSASSVVIYTAPNSPGSGGTRRVKLLAAAKPAATSGTCYIALSGLYGNMYLTKNQAASDNWNGSIVLNPGDQVYVSQGAGGDTGVLWSIAIEEFNVSD